MNNINKKQFTMDVQDLTYLYQYAHCAEFIIETGGGGSSTQCLAQALKTDTAKMVSIELVAEKVVPFSRVEFMIGWSIRFDDIIKKGHPLFFESRYYQVIDSDPAHGINNMEGETDLIRKAIKKHGSPDFFFCDTGEYCGLAEWNIVKDKIPLGGYFAIHDVNYPKSIKGFQVFKQMVVDNNWDIILKTNTRQGLCIGRKIK